MRVFTRGDMDGLTSVVLLGLVEDVTEIVFAHPPTMSQINATLSPLLNLLSFVSSG